MNIPGLLIEYIISGIVAFVWIIMLLFNIPSCRSMMTDYSGIITLLAIPSAYIIGMIIDMLAFTLVRKQKEKIKQKEIGRTEAQNIYSSIDIKELEQYMTKRHLTDKLIISLNMKDMGSLADEIKWRSSRDRIARGFIVNSFLIGVMTTITICVQYNSIHLENVLWIWYVIGILMSVITSWAFSRIWRQFEKLSFRFQILADIEIRQLLEMNEQS